MNREREIRSFGKLIAYHLLPGIVVSLGYAILLNCGMFNAYPKVFVLGLAVILFLLPAELGLVLYAAKKETGSYNFTRILGLKSKLGKKEIFIYTIGLFLLTGMLITVLNPLTSFLSQNVFNWMPSWYHLDDNFKMYSKTMIAVTTVMEFVSLTLIGPIVEEIYFRGFLLSRMKWRGYMGVVINTVLFSMYHLWSPWMILTRIIGMLPLYLVVYKKDSLKLSIFVHCLCNFTDIIILLQILID